MERSEIISALKQLVALMVKGEIQHVVALSQNGRLSAGEIALAISDYPGTISMPPDAAFDDFCMYGVYEAKTEARKIEFDLWYDGKASDLTLSVDVSKGERGGLTMTIDDIHVL